MLDRNEKINPGVKLAMDLAKQHLKDLDLGLVKAEAYRQAQKEHVDELIYMLKLNGMKELDIEKLEDHFIKSKIQTICTEHRSQKQEIKELKKENERLKKLNKFYEDKICNE